MKNTHMRAVRTGASASSVSDSLVHFSIGLESADDSIDGLVRALDNAIVAPAERHAAAPAGDRP